MPTVKGREAVRRFMQRLPAELETRVLRGAGRAGGAVIAEEAKARANNEEVRDGITIVTRRTGGAIVVKIRVKGRWANSLGIWAEYGTEPHFISVDESQREGRSVGRINRQQKLDGAESLVINGRFVGTTVFHPGAQRLPFLRPALDTKRDEAIAAAQGYITARVTRAGIVGGDDLAGDEA